jgi:hypothetical protein
MPNVITYIHINPMPLRDLLIFGHRRRKDIRIYYDYVDLVDYEHDERNSGLNAYK